jgi:PBP1b-binding outer membrane lipoprotein LpoB
MYIPLTDMKIISMTLIVAFMLVSCTSYNAVKLPDHRYSDLNEGDTVKIVTKDGRDLTFQIMAISSEAIIGKDQHILFSEIVTVKKKQVSVGKTVGLVAGILFVGLVTTILVSFAFGGQDFAEGPQGKE